MSTPPSQYFTADQLEAARTEERNKLYATQERLKEQAKNLEDTVAQLTADKDARDKDAADKLAAAKADAKKASDAKLTAEELITARDAEWKAEKDKFQAQMDLDRAIMQKEHARLTLAAYAQRRVAEEIAADTIAPQLVDYIDGTSEEEIEQSIATAKTKTESILESVTNQAPRTGTPGVSPTGFGPSGPLDNLTGQRQFSAEDIQNMSMAEYAKLRGPLGTGRNSNSGMFG
jgi:alanyl-tRNA synthetase